MNLDPRLSSGLIKTLDVPLPGEASDGSVYNSKAMKVGCDPATQPPILQQVDGYSSCIYNP